MSKYEKVIRQGRINSPANIPSKPAFKEDSSLDIGFPSGNQEWTGDLENLPELAQWPTYDSTKKKSEHVDTAEVTQNTRVTAGRTWADVVHGLLSGENIEILFILLFMAAFGLVFWQDGSAGKWDSMDTFWVSVRKVLVFGVVLALMLLLVKWALRIRHR